MKRSLFRVGAALATLALAGTLAACSNNSSSSSSEKPAGPASASANPAAPAPGEDAGFEEQPLGDEVHVGPLVVGGVYFQPVDMKPSGMALSASEANFHLEADASGLEGNTLGYGVGDFVPGLTVDYKIALKDGSGTPVTGTFMQMNASDGPHYGANIALPDAGQYVLTLTVHSPAENGWVLHSDPETGVKGDFWTEPAKLSWDWDYTPHEW